MNLDQSAELRDMLDADDADEREPDELHGDRGPTMVDPRQLAVRISRLKLIGKSAAHYREECRYGDGETDTLARKLGTLADAVAFGKPIAVWDVKTKKGDKISPKSASNKLYAGFKADNPGKVIATPKEIAEATNMVEALRRDPNARPLLFDERVQLDVEVEWKFMGRRCVSHLDALSPFAVCDLKTAESAQPDRFVRQGLWYGYHAQLAFYVDACKAAGLGERDAYIVAVEKGRPCPVTVLQLDERALEAGRKLYRLWFERLLVCEATNDWPGYVQSVVPFTVPDDEPQTLLIGGEEIEI